ncbi:MAG: alpha/beta hydrolase fold domain-containing protein [Planctomycetota bacterium]
MMLKRAVLVAAVAVLSASSALAAKGRRDRKGGLPPPTHEDVKYDTKHERNVLDFWKAESDKPTPVVVWFHGGGFKMGDKGGIRRSNPAIIKGFLERGVSFASCNYPFLEDASYVEIMNHCAWAIRFLRWQQKKWNIDPRRMGVFGASAGALISGFIGYSRITPKRSRDPVDRFASSVSVVGSYWQPMGTEHFTTRIMRRGGPPIFIYSNAPPSDNVHHPKYPKMVKAAADRLRITSELVGGDKNDIPPPPKGETATTLHLKFFCKYLGVKYSADEK